MSNKMIRIAVDILMLPAIILSYIRWHEDPAFHTVTGIACSLLFAIHIWLNRKTLKAYGKSIKKLNELTKLRYLIDVLLIIVWSATIITGFPALGVYTGAIESAFHFGRLHGVFARLGGILVVVHVVQHKKQIKSYLTKRA